MTKSLYNSILLHKRSISIIRFLVLVFLLIHHEWLYSQSNTISITTSSCTNLNGTYIQNGTNNGYPKYTKGTAIIINEFGFSGPEWKIMDNATEKFTSTANYAPRPSGLESTWVSVGGCTMTDISGPAVWQPILTITVDADTVAEATPVNEVTYTFTTSEAFPNQVFMVITDDEQSSTEGRWAYGDWKFDNSNSEYANLTFAPNSTSVSVKIDVLDDTFVESAESSGLDWSSTNNLDDYGVTYPSTFPTYVITSENDPLSPPLKLHLSSCGEGFCFTDPPPSSFGATPAAGVSLNHYNFINGKPRYEGFYTDVAPNPDLEYFYELHYDNNFTPPVWKLSVTSGGWCSENAVFTTETDPVPCGPGSSTSWAFDLSQSGGYDACTNGIVLIDCPKPNVNLSISSNTSSEANPTDIIITATASEALTSNQSVTLTVTGVQIYTYEYTLNGNTTSSITMTIPAGMTSTTDTFKVINDGDIEGVETAILTLSNPSSGISLGSTISKNIIIHDDEACGFLNGVTFLSTQTQVDELLTVTFPGCTNLVGDLTIMDDNDNVDNITDLTPLSGLSNIDGDVTIKENNVLSNLDGLSIDSIGEQLEISNNPALTNIDGLSDLKFAAGLIIDSNIVLTNLDGLSSFEVADAIWVKENPMLTTIDGLSSLWLCGLIIIEDNNNLQSIDGLSSLEFVLLGVLIKNNDALENIQSFPSLHYLGGLQIEDNDALMNIGTYPILDDSISAVIILNNDALTNVDGLMTIKKVYNNIEISGNDALINLDGLSNLDSLGNKFKITNNAMLDQCCGAYPIINDDVNNGGIAIGGAITISGNLMGCNTTTEIIDECAVPPVYENVETGAKFGTLQDAIDMATSGDTIKLLANATDTNAVTVNKNICIKASGFDLTISDVNMTIESGKMLVWLEEELTIQSGAKIINNGVLHNKATIIHLDTFTNTGTYKGRGIWQGNFVNNGKVSPGGQ